MTLTGHLRLTLIDDRREVKDASAYMMRAIWKKKGGKRGQFFRGLCQYAFFSFPPEE